MIDLSGQTALVTGASRGLGLATAKALAQHGAAVVLAARSRDAVLGEAAAIVQEGGQATGLACDVARYRDVAAAVEQTVSHYGSLDILVNNAGTIDPISMIAEADPDHWGAAIDVNLKGVFHGLRAAIPVMSAQGAGVIVNISSGAANSALEGWSHYCSSKAAAKMLTASAHREVADLGIRVVGLSPGTVATDMMARIKQSGINPVSALDWSVHKSPESAAEAVVFLCGPEGGEFAGTDFSIKTEEGRRRAGLGQ